MTLDEALDYIHRVDWRGSVPGLSRIDALLNKKPSLKRPSSREVFEEHEAEIRQGDYAK